MSFLNKIKGWGQDRNARSRRGRDQRTSRSTTLSLTTREAMPIARRRPTHQPLDVPTQPARRCGDSSIITEAAPSEMADFSETRIQGG